MSQSHARRSSLAGRAIIEWLAVALIGVSLVTAAAMSGGAPDVETSATRTVSVNAGDTLWEIASDHPVPGLTTAETVDVLTELNGLHGPVLAAGSSLIVPAEDAHSEAVALR